MLNVHTQLLDDVAQKKMSPDDFFILLLITKRIGRNNKSFPSIKTLMKESTFSEEKISKCIKNLVKNGHITKEQRHTGRFSSNIYNNN